MNRMADKIAAFAPISGYPMGGGVYTSSRPVPIIHTHGTTDDVVGFGGVSGVLAGWVKRNGCPATPTTVKPYRVGHITKHTWGPGENGVEVVLLELANKGLSSTIFRIRRYSGLKSCPHSDTQWASSTA